MRTVFELPFVLAAIAALLPAPAALRAADSATIVSPAGASVLERLAAAEVRRYVYVRTGALLPLAPALPAAGDAIVVAAKDNAAVSGLDAGAVDLKPQEFLLKTVKSGDRTILLVAGGDAAGTLYGAYRFAELLGVRFHLHGDTIPDEKIPFALPAAGERARPLFELRGIQPFHDFPEGPDWWSLDGYKAVLAQLPKLGMNFFGLHTYPEGGVGPEPLTWIGLAEDANPDGTVRFSYPARHFTTVNGTWGYNAKPTDAYSFGAAALFTRNDYGPEYMRDRTPWPRSPRDSNELFNDMGAFLREALTFARGLAIKTCLGTELPLTVPTPVKNRLKEQGKDPADPAVVQQLYEGLFTRIARTHPLDYYWFWTHEGWTWSGVGDAEVAATFKDLDAAIAAARNVKAPFTLATCGWVLGPPKDRAQFDKVLPKEMPLSCISRNVGFAFVERGFREIKGRPAWSIPWLEDDPGLTIPQLWVGRMRRDAADSLAYGCTGLMGIHWRTRILAPNVSALAKAAWDQRGWNPDFGKPPAPPAPKPFVEGAEGGNAAAFPGNAIDDTDEDAVYQTVRYDVRAYRLKVPAGACDVTLKFCEPHYKEAGKRVFGVKLQGAQVIEGLDIFAKVGQNKALDLVFKDVKAPGGILAIEFTYEVEYPSIAGIAVASAAGGAPFARKINCGGPAFKDYEADFPPAPADSRPRDLPCADFYADWAAAEFGPGAAEEIGALFASIDGLKGSGESAEHARLPRPATWVDGPGGITPDATPWEEVQKRYTFVKVMEALRPHVRGAGNLERFDYWLNHFRYLRATGKVNCVWARFNAAMAKAKAEKDEAARKKLAAETALPIRVELVAAVADAHLHLLSAVSTMGCIGNVTNWQQHILPRLLEGPGAELEQILGAPLPPEAQPARAYAGPPRLLVPEVRTSVNAGEALNVTAIVLGPAVRELGLFYRPLGRGGFVRQAFSPLGRGVYKAVLPARVIEEDFEYHVECLPESGAALRFPAAAPAVTQTVVVMRPE